jgi:thiamine biosynthesis lipoprotein
MGPDLARTWFTALDGYDAYAITPDGHTWHTPGFAPRIASA